MRFVILYLLLGFLYWVYLFTTVGESWDLGWKGSVEFISGSFLILLAWPAFVIAQLGF